METEHLAGLFLQQVAVDGAWAHHHDLLLQRLALGLGLPILGFRGGNLVIERDESQIRTLPRNQVIAEIEGQADPDDGDQVLAGYIFLVDQSLHMSTESQRSLQVKQNRPCPAILMWKQKWNKTPK